MKPSSLRKLRIEIFQMTQAQFGEMLGVAMRTIQDWEHGRRRIPKIAERFLEHLQKCNNR